MTDAELIGIIQSHRTDSLGCEDGDVSNDRATAMDHYHGRPYGNEVEGRSQVVSRDLAEAVDWAMPAIMRTFVQSGTIAEFDPVNDKDEQLAQQESDYVQQVLMKDNAGFMVLHDAIKDTLLLKNGYVKHWWAVEDKISTEAYTGLSMDAITQMIGQLEADGAEVEVVEQDSKLIEMPGHMMPPMAQPPGQMPMQGGMQGGMPMQGQMQGQLMMGAMPSMPPMMMGEEVFDIKLKITRKDGKAHVEAVPAEEVRVSKKCRGSLQTSPFTEHVTRKTRSDLREMGMPEEFVDTLPAFNERAGSTQAQARDSSSDEGNSDTGSSVNDRSMDEIEFCEAYVKVDFDGDGVAELRKVVTCADKIPPGDDWNEPIPAVPMTGYVAKRIPHRHIGESLDDDLSEFQEILTTLKRQMLDNIYLVNNSEKAINERVNIKDMMSTTAGGLKRVSGSGPIDGSIMPLVTPSVIGEILPVIGHFNEGKENRSGVSKTTSGMDPDTLKQSTKGAFLENLNRASQKIEMMTRMIAESGVKEMVLQIHSLLIRHQDRARMVQLRGKWVNVNPQEWRERTALTVRVGLGTGNAEEKKAKLMMMMQMQDRLHQLFGMVGPQEAFALYEDVGKALDFDMPEKYAMSPGSQAFQQMQQQKQGQPPPEVMIEKMKGETQGQLKTMELQHAAQSKQAELAQQGQLEQARMTMQAQVDQNRQQVEAQQQQAKMSMERELEQFKAQLQHDLEREKLSMQQQTAVLIARINAESRIDAAQLTAQSTLSAQQEAASDGAVDA